MTVYARWFTALLIAKRGAGGNTAGEVADGGRVCGKGRAVGVGWNSRFGCFGSDNRGRMRATLYVFVYACI